MDDAASNGRVRNARGKGALLRATILDAAGRILARDGGEAGITIRAVTREAGLAPQSFYLQFDSVSDLLWAIYADGYEQFTGVLTEAVESADPGERLPALATAYLGFSRKNPGLYRTLMTTVGAPHPEWDPARLPGAAAFALVQTVIADDRPDSKPDARFLAATMLWTQLHGLAALMLDRPTFPWPPDDVLVERVVAQASA